MKASAMTNEELAKELDNVLVNDELQAFADVERQQEAVREAAKRLRNAEELRCLKGAAVAELRECLARRSSHMNSILQKALELGNDVPIELRKVMDECIVAEDKAIGFGVFSIKKGSDDECK